MEGIIKKNKTNNLLRCFLFTIICVDCSFVMVNLLSGTVRMVISLLAVIIVLIFNNIKLKLNKFSFIVFLYLITYSVILGVFSDNIKSTIIFVSAMLFGLIISEIFDRRTFIKYYDSIIFFLACFSIVTFVLQIFFISNLSWLPVVLERSGKTYYTVIFSVISNNTYINRNYGLFWEPGTFSIFLNIALYFELYESKKSDVKKVMVYIVTIITTLSTLGIICVLLLLASFMLNKSDKKNSVKTKKILVVLGIVGLIVLIIYGESFIFYVFDKLKFDGIELDFSTKVRFYAVKYPLLAFLERPIFGIGYKNFLVLQEQYCFNLATCTPLNWLAIFGVLGGIIPTFGILCFFLKEKKKIFSKIFIIIFALVLFSTENFLQITYIYILIFYGVKQDENSFIFNNRIFVC